MNRLDISNWKEFKIAELFITETSKNKLQVPTEAAVAKKDLTDGDIPRVTVTNMNNGIVGYYKNVQSDNYRLYENFISVSFLGTIFYHPYKASLDMKVHCLKLKERRLNNYIAFFLINIIKKQVSYFAYNDQLSSSTLTGLSILLPVKNNEPDWEYMENYTKQLYLRDKQSISTVEEYINKPTEKSISLGNWKRFHLYDDEMFDIDMGTKLDKIKMTSVNPTINFIGRANKSNGITERVDEISGLKPYEAGNLTLSLGGEYLGSCFIQPSPFYTSQNVVVLKPKWQMSFNVKMFIAIMVFKESRLYYKAFIDELNRHIKTDFSIYLPTKNDAPDWQYMEAYISYLFQQQSNTLQHLV
ncbi:restriction endonuclease subunit S [Haemophilus haemolyticus]|uniref:Type I restriction modification DNA specificity domain-containing protein n=1 Tax=Haemophilus haemolyticus TaxID=726 RepID=A0A502J778_HAEHA|nr:restriction endonuclease subunit S [Haemophilus haemolyticus]NYA26123.1 restriction endonuclease subunit S [Haemophilus haemolyticus]TPG94789.1 hypothetical protein EUX55_08945 [Haemophilus haemolyticus]